MASNYMTFKLALDCTGDPGETFWIEIAIESDTHVAFTMRMLPDAPAALLVGAPAPTEYVFEVGLDKHETLALGHALLTLGKFLRKAED